jgi:peptide deformylase
MVKEIVQIGDKRLSDVSDPVDLSDRENNVRLAANLIDTANFYVKEAAGLSAVQIGILKRMFVVREYDFDNNRKSTKNVEWKVMINPEIKIIDDDLNIEWEGCLSVGKGKAKLFAPVVRPEKIRVTYFDLEGERHEIIATEFFSNLIQHELDHLNGILFLSYVKNPKNIWKESDLDKYIRQNQKFPEIAYQ